ncbi:MAG: prepilin peptidase [Planctomycetaceae bacterium]|nr:prepilin peptidase [Planctomycetaceae bacterium]
MTALATGSVLAASSVWVRNDLPMWIVLPFVFWLGAICGSFLNVCVYRLPQYPHGAFWPAIRGLWSPPSSCPRCRELIRWYDNVPVFGWLMLRGRCRNCKMWISPQYPLVEFLNGLLFVLVYWMEVPSGIRAPLEQSCLFSLLGPQTHPGLGWLSPELWVHLRLLYHLLLIEALLAASLIDLRLMIIPDTVTLPTMAVGVVAAAIFGRLGIIPVWFQEPRLARDFSYVGPDWLQWMVSEGPAVPAWIEAHPYLHGVAVSIAGLIVGGGSTWVIRAVGTWGLKREAMGDGDVVLMAMVGSFIGWQPVVIAFFIAPLFVFVVFLLRMTIRMSEEIPYGPYLSLGTLATILGWRWVWPSFERMFNLGPLLVLFCGAGLILFVAILLGLQLFKQMLGYPTSWEEHPPGEWTAADQTQYYAGEQVDRFTGQWRQPDHWPGTAAGRGTLFQERWRRWDR